MERRRAFIASELDQLGSKLLSALTVSSETSDCSVLLRSIDQYPRFDLLARYFLHFVAGGPFIERCLTRPC